MFLRMMHAEMIRLWNLQSRSAKDGITSFHDAGIDRSTIDRYKKFKKESKLGVRIYAMLTGWDEILFMNILRKVRR